MKMLITCHSFSLQKDGNSPEENEDAFCTKNEVKPKTKNHLFAVADGATETSYSSKWAKLLVDAYCEGIRTDKDLKKQLVKLQKLWKESVGSSPLPWYAEEKLSKGAFSSLVGLTLKNNAKRGTWQALAVGDSCLFQIRNDEIVIKFPLSSSEQFSNRPALLSTNLKLNDSVSSREKGDFEAGDQFYLMTDAIACWFLTEYERGDKPWHAVHSWLCSDSINRNIQELRKEKKINNDDVTIVLIDITK